MGNENKNVDSLIKAWHEREIWNVEHGMSLRFVHVQTPEICLAAVKRDPEALAYVSNQTPEICREAVSRNPRTLKYVGDGVDDQTYLDLCWLAVTRNLETIAYVGDRIGLEEYRKICLRAVKKDGMLLRWVRKMDIDGVYKQMEDVCRAAVNQNPNAAMYVLN